MEFLYPQSFQPFQAQARSAGPRGLLGKALAWTNGLLSTFLSGPPRRPRVALRNALDCGLLTATTRRGRARPTARQRSLARLRWALMGNTKQAIVSIFGPPRTAVADGPVLPSAEPIFQADTWYYPIDERRRMAIAIQFNRNEVRQVEFLATPA